jgi:hypothetical protein
MTKRLNDVTTEGREEARTFTVWILSDNAILKLISIENFNFFYIM